MTTTTCDDFQGLNLDIFEETALAVAQAEIQDAMDKSCLRRTDLAMRLGKPRSFISKILGGNHNLTIRTMARLFAACGFELRFSKVAAAVEWQPTTTHSVLATSPVGEVPVPILEVMSSGTRPAGQDNAFALAA